MQYQGVLTKMQTYFANPVQYYLVFKNDFINLNQALKKKIKINFLAYECLECGLDKKIFRQGFCYDCFYSAPQAGDWIMQPELSRAHLGIEDRDLDYEKSVQLQPHVVYLANSSNVKVGVPRKSQIPTRWIDQGAHEAIEVVEVPNRYLAGIAEVALKQQVSDKTNWRKMLKNEVLDLDLKDLKEQLKTYLPTEVQPYYLAEQQELEIQFPVLKYPQKPQSLQLDKTLEYEGILAGIKGQYLIFEDDTVFNVRNFEGYVVQILVA